jgi:hypothetical protein
MVDFRHLRDPLKTSMRFFKTSERRSWLFSADYAGEAVR